MKPIARTLAFVVTAALSVNVYAGDEKTKEPAAKDKSAEKSGDKAPIVTKKDEDRAKKDVSKAKDDTKKAIGKVKLP